MGELPQITPSALPGISPAHSTGARHDPTPRSLDRLIRPRSIAVFGGKEARRVIEQCDKMGFAGDIWPVHPREEEILGRRCYRSVSTCRGAGCLLRRGQPRAHDRDHPRSRRARRGGAVCYASGFREAANELADGNDLQEALVAGGRRHGRSSGPTATASSTCWTARCSGPTSTACFGSNAASRSSRNLPTSPATSPCRSAGCRWPMS